MKNSVQVFDFTHESYRTATLLTIPPFLIKKKKSINADCLNLIEDRQKTKKKRLFLGFWAYF